MIRAPLDSSMIASVGYDGANRTLEIELADAHLYQYFQVPEPVYKGLLDAPSAGSYFHRFIKDKFSFKRIS
jgi:hypothetical protein